MIFRYLPYKLKPPYKIGLQTQLIILVCIVALLSLIILAVIMGIYFTGNYKALRAERLNVVSQLKSSQIDQNLNYLYYQCYWITTRDTIQNALLRYRAGNISEDNWADSTIVLEKFLSSSNLFSLARLYDSNFNTVINVTNNGTGDLVAPEVLETLFPLSIDEPLPSSLQSIGILTDPVLNISNYLMSMSLPIFGSSSILLYETEVTGYVTVIMSAESLKGIFNDSTALNKLTVSVISAVYNDKSELTKYHYIFPPNNVDSVGIDIDFPIINGSFVDFAFTQGKNGFVKNTDIFFNRHTAVGYSPCSFKLVEWVAIIFQPENVFLSPSIRLTKIIIGTVIGIAVFMCLLTFPLAHWAAKPIIGLQKATEIISAGRGLKSYNDHITSPGGDSFILGENSLTSIQKQKCEMSDSGLEKVTLEKEAFPGKSTQSNSFSKLIHPDKTQIQKECTKVPTFASSDHMSISTDRYITSTNLIEARIPVYRRLFIDELSELTDTFNNMTDELDRHYALLEDRVRARTKQLESAKLEAEAANEAKTIFIANISHELRTPLNGILGMTAVAMTENNLQRVHNSLKLIFRSGELLLHILTELLTFSKNVLKRNKLEERNFLLMDIALQIKSIFGKLAKDQHVKLTILLVPNSIRTMVLWGDSNRIIQIVMNLVSNALKFTPVDGKVDMRIKLLGEYDREKSKACDYTEVYLKSSTDDCFDDNQLRSSTKSQETVITNDTEIMSDDLNEGNDVEEKNDSISIVSTLRSYNDMILSSQFRHPPSFDRDNKDNNIIPKSDDSKTWVISIEVEDTGPGIEPSLQESVFEPFIQGDQTLSRQYGGTGLGLSICRQLAEMMNGTVKLESKVGVGSKFTFMVPLTQTGEHSGTDIFNTCEDEFNMHSNGDQKMELKDHKDFKSQKSKTFIPSSQYHTNDHASNSMCISDTELSVGSVRIDRPFLQSTGTALSTKKGSPPGMEQHSKILVAEDNNVNQEVIKRLLKLEGFHHVDLACDGQEAFDKVETLTTRGESYNIIFMDVQMPRVDGLLATKMIRNKLQYKHPIVALTAFADDSNIKECLDSGMNGFLAKPIRRVKLKAILDQYLPQNNENEQGDKPKRNNE